MGDVRKVYLKPRLVISGSTSVAHTKGTPSRSAIWVATMVAALWLVPVMATQPRWITFSVCEPATSGLDSVSATMYFSLAPPRDLMPPCWLTRSQPSWKAFHVRWPQAALGPVRATTAASNTSFGCAVARRGARVVEAAASVVVLMKSRRVMRDMITSSSVDQAFQRCAADYIRPGSRLTGGRVRETLGAPHADSASCRWKPRCR